MGTLRKCRWEDAEPHSVEIIESRRRRPANPRLRELHPLLRNLGRLDEWVKLEQLDLSSVDTDVYGEATRMRTQNQKRKMEEASTEFPPLRPGVTGSKNRSGLSIQHSGNTKESTF
ncbi:putative MYST-like histone acetyltransferase 1 isoform X1 [Elaeis guineensis]|uniref:putative MYST-like histone acetyltransferase 1 isoform X1 n=1 Tax=Elaeis guineensis var. tenera TaxID=51953 RepID=UPI003C6D4DB4